VTFSDLSLSILIVFSHAEFVKLINLTNSNETSFDEPFLIRRGNLMKEVANCDEIHTYGVMRTHLAHWTITGVFLLLNQP
jgi:hypothetical protein